MKCPFFKIEVFTGAQNHINGIENLWNRARRYLRRHNGIPRDSFSLYLKECEWRFNNPSPRYQFKEKEAKAMG